MLRNRTKYRDRFVLRQLIALSILILLAAAALRLLGMPGIPPGPHYDEAANGILAAEIATGVKTPIFIPSYTGKEALFFYAVAVVMRFVGIGLLGLRLTSALVGLLTVAAAAWAVYELFVDDDPGGAPWLAVLTAALIATSFWHVVLSRIGFRAIMQPLLQASTLGMLWRGLRSGDWRGSKNASNVWLLLGGVVFGLTGYTYLAARAFPIPLVVGLFVLWLADTGYRRQRLIQFALFGLAALVSFAPLGFYFFKHPEAFTTRVGQVGPGSDWHAAGDGLVAALGMFFWDGDPYIRFNLPFRPLFGPVVAAFFLVGLAVTVWRFFRPLSGGESSALKRAREALLLVWIPVLLLPTALAINEVTPSNLRAIGLIPLIFVFPARGLWVLLGVMHFPARIKAYVPLIATGLLLLGTLWTTGRAYFVEYAPRTDLYEASDGDLADIAAFLNEADLSDTSVYVGSIHYRHPTLAFLADVYSQIKWLVGASTAVYPASGEAIFLFPRSAVPDADWFAHYVPDAVPIESLNAPDGAPAFVGYRLAPSLSHVDEALAEFSGVVRLLDYDVARAVSGDGADITVVWEILAPPPDSGLTPFYHLVDPWGFRWGQAEPFQYAAEDWTPGEIVVERIQVPIAPGAPPGDYVLEAGLYSQNAGTRLAVVDGAGRFAGTTVPLTLTVARAEMPPDVGALGIRERLDLQTGTGLTLLGVNLDTTRARPGEPVYFTLFWQADPDYVVSQPSQRGDYVVGLVLEDAGENAVAIYEGGPVHGTYPTSRWIDGEVLVDRYHPRLPLSAAGAPPGDYVLSLTITTADGETLLAPTALGKLDLVATERLYEVPEMDHAQNVVLADQVELLGYDVDLIDAQPGGAIQLTLYWRALAKMDTSYTVYTHVLGSDGQIAAQQDNVPVLGTYPTTLWLPGEVVVDPYRIALADDFAPGDYPIQVGFYFPEDGLRLADPTTLDSVISIRP